MPPDNLAISGRILLPGDLDGREVAGQTRAGDLTRLLAMVALGHEDQPVPGGQLGQSLFHAREQFDLLRGD